MKNPFTRYFASLGTAFTMAVAGTGCSTTQTLTHKEQDCLIGQQTKSQLLLIFVASTNTGENYSKACSEGKLAASTTLIGRDAGGNLSPGGALFALEFQKIIADKIGNGTEDAQKFGQDILHYFKFYLKSMGNLTLDDIQKYVDAQIAANQNQPQTPEPKQDRQTPIILPKCSGVGSIRSCK